MKQDKFSVKLKNIDTMYQFLHDAKSLSNNITAGQGIYSVDAKSLMGLLSLDLRQEIEVVIYGDIGLGDLYTLRKYIS
jgi:phosphotransferase system HPr-like phosphotransfer protein